MKLIIVRHGYSTSNASGCYTGQQDAPLSDLGHRQAELLADYFSGADAPHIDAIYSSDLCRAVDTVAPTARRLSLPIIKLPALRELDTGLWTGVPYGEVKERYAEDFRHYIESVDAPCTGGESLREGCARVLRAVGEIEKCHPNGTVLLCSHAMCSRLFTALSLGGGIEGILKTKAPANAVFSIYLLEGDRVTPLETDHTEHLNILTQTSLPGLV